MRLIPAKPLLAFGMSAYLTLSPLLAMAMAPLNTSITDHQGLSQTAQAVHVLNRLGYGPHPGDVEMVQRMGVNRYIQSQLHPESIPEDTGLTASLSQLEAIHRPPLQLLMTYGPLKNGKNATPDEKKQHREQANGILRQAMEAHLLRARYSNRQLQEVMTEFWFNHFNIFAKKGLDTIWIGSYEETAIRPYALGRFRDLLEATSHHPAMLFYLDNWQNSAPQAEANASANGKKVKSKGLNENYARELMELHTLGVDGGYTQQDVISLARILTGWGFPHAGALWNAQNKTANRPAMQQRSQTLLGGNGFHFDAKRHDFTDKQFLGHAIAGSGEAEGEQALDILARHPATAKLICTQLAQYFVSDHPSPALVQRLSQRYLQTDGNIQAVLDTLFQSPDFWAAANVGSKFKTPYRYVVSALRAADFPLENIRPLTYTLTQMGMPLYGCETPNGYKYTQEAWLNPDGMTQRINFAVALSAGRISGKKAPRNQGGPMTPAIDALALQQTMGLPLAPATEAALQEAPAALRPALLLGSPEFMKY